MKWTSWISVFVLCALTFAQKAGTVSEFVFERELRDHSEIRIINPHGRVSVETDSMLNRSTLRAASMEQISEGEIVVSSRQSRITVEVVPGKSRKRIDLSLRVPERRRVIVETAQGEVRFAGVFAALTARSTTGSIITDIPLKGSAYRFSWTGSRPRVVSDAPIERARERIGGRYEIAGRFQSDGSLDDGMGRGPGPSRIDFETERGVVLVNVTLADAPSEIRERPLTELSKAIVMTGDAVLTEAVRRAAPEAFAEFSSNLRGRRSAPSLAKSDSSPRVLQSTLVVQVVDSDNRAVSGLRPEDFEVYLGDERVVVDSVGSESTPFDVVLLIDVSGSVDDYIDFVRRAAGTFLETISARDRVAILSFNEELKRLSGFSRDRASLSAVLFDLEAGGGTALYDSLGLILADTIRSAESDRTAVIILSDGDDNKSFVNFNSLTGVIEESSTLIYPLYVPSGLVLASRLDASGSSIDPSRVRYMTLTSKAEDEGERLARLSGGVYYPIKRVEEIQQAYGDIVARLRTSYTLTYRPALNDATGKQPRRIRVNVKRDDVTVTFRGAPAVLER